MSWKVLVLGKLQPKRKIDNFCSSHRCTSDVRLWSGARLVFKHRRVPLRPLTFFLFYFFFSRGFLR